MRNSYLHCQTHSERFVQCQQACQPGHPEQIFEGGCWTPWLAGHTKPSVSPLPRCIPESPGSWLTNKLGDAVISPLGKGALALVPLFLLSPPSTAGPWNQTVRRGEASGQLYKTACEHVSKAESICMHTFPLGLQAAE